MGAKLDTQKLGFVFQSRPDILEGIQRAADSPGRVALFNEIANHVYDTIHGNGEPAHKKRRVDVDQTNANRSTNGTKPNVTTNAADEAVLLEIKEISVSVPQRKKFELCFTANHLYARAPGTTAPVPAITYAWQDIEFAFYLPVPEKSQVQHNYILFPRGVCLPSKTNPPTEEPLVFTVPSTAPKQGTIGGPDAGSASAVSDTYKSLFHWALNRHLKPNGIDIVASDPNKFHSMVRQPHRPKEKAVHVKAFRGSKDGYLFFLETGIFWGFKKPLMFIPLNRIVATSYTNILQRTFNVVVEVFAGEGDATEEIEFSMLDQEDYGGIDDYVKRHRLQDRSMAEQRKAKLELAENRGPKKGSAAAENGDEAAANGEDGMTELEKAHLEAQEQPMFGDDDDDEDEEDYDPGSDGESEGSGESSDDDDDDDEDDEDDDEGEDGEGEENAAEDAEEEEVAAVEPEPEPVKPTKPARGARGARGANAAKGVKAEKPTKQTKQTKTAQAAKPARAPRASRATKSAQPAEPAKPVQTTVPIKSGWAALGGTRRTNDAMDLDEEQFDVVG